jgi:hypothetical protein
MPPEALARYTGGMKPINRKTTDIDARAPWGGRTRGADAPLDAGAEKSFEDTEPAGFGDEPRHSIEAAVSDPDMDDTIGGE